MVQQIYKSSATGKGTFSSLLHVPYRNGAGVGTADDANNEEIDFKTVAEFLADDELKEQLQKMGFTEEAQQKAAKLFYQTVEERFNADDPFRQSLLELLNDYTPSPFISDEDLNVVELLANRIQDLEETIA